MTGEDDITRFDSRRYSCIWFSVSYPLCWLVSWDFLPVTSSLTKGHAFCLEASAFAERFTYCTYLFLTLTLRRLSDSSTQGQSWSCPLSVSMLKGLYTIYSKVHWRSRTHGIMFKHSGAWWGVGGRWHDGTMKKLNVENFARVFLQSVSVFCSPTGFISYYLSLHLVR